MTRKPTVKPTMADIAYTAGIVDGEGCLRIFRLPHHGHIYHGMGLWVENTDYRLLDWLQKRWGGRIGRARKPRKPTHNVAWQWTISRQKALPVLLAVQPYLVIKREVCTNAITFIQTRTDSRHEPKSDPAILAQRAALYENHLALVSRGRLIGAELAS